MRDRIFRPIFCIVLLLFIGNPIRAEIAVNPPAAAIRSAPNAVVFADGWGIGRLFSGGGRARVVQVSVVAMGIALFIMMRKFNG